jgi:putative transposase
MQPVEQHRSDRHNPGWRSIDVAALASNNLYNAALSLTSEEFIHHHQVIPYENLARDVKITEAYCALPANVAQWALRQGALAWKRSCAACAAWEANPSRFVAHPKLPKYLPKRGRHLLTSIQQAISRSPKNRGYVVPSGLEIRVETRRMAPVRIVPHASHSPLEVLDERPVTPADIDPTRIAAIDIGLNHLAAVTAHQPGVMPLLVHGRPLKAINQWYNKRRAHLRAKILPGVFVQGRTGWRPGADHRGESDTSQASFLDSDPLPVYEPASPAPVFSGRRLKRGLYRAADGRRLNAAVNGAYNIMRTIS